MIPHLQRLLVALGPAGKSPIPFDKEPYRQNANKNAGSETRQDKQIPPMCDEVQHVGALYSNSQRVSRDRLRLGFCSLTKR